MVNIERLINFILKKADNVQESAGYNGSWDDGGAARLREEVKFYRYGLLGEIPEEWKKHIVEYRRENDPEYDEYKRLKEKFEK